MPVFTRYPVINLGAEYLAMGYLMRRNILAYKAPPNNEGYDIICIHPDPRRVTRQVRVQVKSRLATDSDRSILVRPSTLDAFDFLIVVYLNIGYFSRMAKKHPLRAGNLDPELFVLPRDLVLERRAKQSDWGKVRLKGVDLSRYAGPRGIELIARELRIKYAVKAKDAA
ncbi:MAG: hypothetical protein WD906_00030 [Anaerolineales bacterium]